MLRRLFTALSACALFASIFFGLGGCSRASDAQKNETDVQRQQRTEKKGD